MHSAVISDASCLIVLYEIHALDLLKKTYGAVITTPEIAAEARFQLPNWIVVQSPSKTSKKMPSSIDTGEASAISLALEIPGSLLILDERTARNYARKLGLTVTGTLGVIAKAKLDGVIPSIRPLIEAIRKTDFRFSAAVEADVYAAANEDAN
jgi:predicted nucleic acid-binding protein